MCIRDRGVCVRVRCGGSRHLEEGRRHEAEQARVERLVKVAKGARLRLVEHGGVEPKKGK
eukprot:5520267-Prymnesium_polylepis.1